VSTGPYPVEPVVALAIERLRLDIVGRLVALETKVDALTSPAPAPSGTGRAATAGAVSAGAVLGLVEGLKRFFG